MRGVLTVDLDCERCRGTGRIVGRLRIPGRARAGGPPDPGVPYERLCGCVRVEPPDAPPDPE